MRLVAYYSKVFTIAMCLYLAVFASTVFILVRDRHNWLTITMIVMAVLLIVICIIRMVRGKAVLIADETGLYDCRVNKSVIRWNDIQAFCHVPRVVRHNKRQISFSPFDSWRPIQLWIASPPPTILSKLQALSRRPVHACSPHAHFVLIDFTGLDTPSSQFAEAIRSYAPNAKEKKS